MGLTRTEQIMSLPLDSNTNDKLIKGWQEIRACVFVDFGSHSPKSSKHRLKAVVAIANPVSKSYGEVTIWAASTWKSIVRVNLSELPGVNISSANERSRYKESVDWLFEVAYKVVDY